MNVDLRVVAVQLLARRLRRAAVVLKNFIRQRPGVQPFAEKQVDLRVAQAGVPLNCFLRVKWDFGSEHAEQRVVLPNRRGDIEPEPLLIIHHERNDGRIGQRRRIRWGDVRRQQRFRQRLLIENHCRDFRSIIEGDEGVRAGFRLQIRADGFLSAVTRIGEQQAAVMAVHEQPSG